MRRPARWLSAGAVLAAPAAAAASDTVSYSYDALGRLVAIATVGGPNDSMAVSTGYDPAGNRASYGVSGAGASGAAPASLSSPPAGVASGLDEERPAAEAPAAAAVEPPPPGGIPDESEPAVEIELPGGGAPDDPGPDR
jgi:hypothetical protein